MRRMQDVDKPGKRIWKDEGKRDMTEAGLKEDNATNGSMEE